MLFLDHSRQANGTYIPRRRTVQEPGEFPRGGSRLHTNISVVVKQQTVEHGALSVKVAGLSNDFQFEHQSGWHLIHINAKRFHSNGRINLNFFVSGGRVSPGDR
jgi:hypothetical protein